MKTEISKKDMASNRLGGEKSPYLLQHAHNPVDWYPWGDEAFERAIAEDRPIFLSIGYSTCHWCHVMAHESFEDPEVARLMNDAFVNIKVDREERPDIDSNYMAAAQVLTGTGGWPLTIIMTPLKKPFFAATYIPKESRYGRVGMLDLIPRVKALWEKEREKALDTAENLTAHLQKLSTAAPGPGLVRGDLDQAFQLLSGLFDSVHGGFSRAPKFPTPHNLMFLLRYWKRTSDETALGMVERTLEEMGKGGVYDHLGFGFHRYSTDERWLVPHFEKMLYDQALLIMAYAEAYEATKNDVFRETAVEALTYVMRDMTSPEGGFYSAEDADSEGVEGKFYVWTAAEIMKTLPQNDAELIVKAYNVETDGNFLNEATKAKTGENILHQRRDLSEIADELGIPLKKLKDRLEKGREQLFLHREKRVHPGKDDKILCDWNGLMIAAFAKAGRVFDEPRYTGAASRAADFIFSNMIDSHGRLRHTFKDGEANIMGFLDDHAFLVWGLLELYETTFEAIYLGRAVELTGQMIQHFWDNEEGGFFSTPDDGEELLIRKKEVYDGAQPSGNSVAMHNLLRLSRLTGNPDFEKKAAAIAKVFSRTVKQYPAGYTHFMSAVDQLIGPGHEVVIVGNKGEGDTQAMLKALRSGYNPNMVVIFKEGNEENQEITKIAEFTSEHSMIKGKATAYVCINQTCNKPTTDPDEMMRMLDGSADNPVEN